MAYDKLIDSAQLDSALTATADAIRAKTGGSSKIAWDATKGFADAIASLVGAKTGTFTPTYPGYGKDTTVNVSGLGSKGSTVLLFVNAPDNDGGLEGRCLYAIFDGSSTKSWYAYASLEESEYEDENGDPYIDYSAYLYTYMGNNVSITVNDDGFSVKSSSDYWDGNLATGYTYTYYYF